jgi:Holliday junction resolvasome RuvABC ATP-dependent DNA helicase subunit
VITALYKRLRFSAKLYPAPNNIKGRMVIAFVEKTKVNDVKLPRFTVIGAKQHLGRYSATASVTLG